METWQIVSGTLVALASAIGGFWAAIAKSKVDIAESKIKLQEAFAKEKETIISDRDSVARGADSLVKTTMGMLERQDKQIETANKHIKEVQDYYQSKIKGLESNMSLMQGEIKDLQHTYNQSLTQDRVILQKAVDENTSVLKKTNQYLEELKSKSA